MSDLAFRQLAYSTKLVSAETLFFNQVREWEKKRDRLRVQLEDITKLMADHRERSNQPYPNDIRIKCVDFAPTIRLANACEATANCIYSIAEIAANFANKASKCNIPSSFNQIRKNCENNATSDLAITLGDLQWYKKVRELRTEWAHYSSIFIAEDNNGEVILCVRAYRRKNDREEFSTPNFSCTVKQFVDWVVCAQSTIDRFAGYILKNYVLPKFSLDHIITIAVYDQNGFPIIKADFSFEVETISINEYLSRGGIDVS